MASNDANRCIARTKRGRCRMTTNLDGDGRCLWHSTEPRRVKKARAARRKGALASVARRWARASPPTETIATPADAERWSAWLARALVSKTIDVRYACEINRAIKTFLASHAVAERLADLEREVRELRRRFGKEAAP